MSVLYSQTLGNSLFHVFFFFFSVQNTIDFRFVQGLGRQNMSGSVSDVVINLAAFDKERRASTKSRVKLYSFLLGVVNWSAVRQRD